MVTTAQVTPSKNNDVRSSLFQGQPTNPVLQRLKKRLLAEAEASEAITSYDRMHHRHNRS